MLLCSGFPAHAERPTTLTIAATATRHSRSGCQRRESVLVALTRDAHPSVVTRASPECGGVAVAVGGGRWWCRGATAAGVTAAGVATVCGARGRGGRGVQWPRWGCPPRGWAHTTPRGGADVGGDIRCGRHVEAIDSAPRWGQPCTPFEVKGGLIN